MQFTSKMLCTQLFTFPGQDKNSQLKPAYTCADFSNSRTKVSCKIARTKFTGPLPIFGTGAAEVCKLYFSDPLLSNYVY